MAYLNTYPSQNSCTMSVGGLNTSSTYSEIYISCNGSNSSNLIYGGSGYSTSKSWTIYSLSSGTQYWASYRLKTQAGSEARDGAYFWTSSPPAPPQVGDVYSVSASNSGIGSIYVSWYYATNATEYMVEIWDGYGGYLIDSKIVYDNYTYMYNMPQGRYIQIKVYGRRSGSPNGTPRYAYLTTTDYSVGMVPYVNVSGIPNISGALSVSWGSATNAETYRVEIYNSNGTWTGKEAEGGYTSATIYGLAENTYYQAKVYGRRSGMPNGTPNYGYGYTASFAPQAVTSLVVNPTSNRGEISFYWSSATNAHGYRWEVYRGDTTNATYLVSSSSTTNTNAVVNGLLEYTYYTVKVYAYRSGYTNGTPITRGVTTGDLTPPVISSISGDGNGKVYFSWSAYDSHSGMRSVNTYYTQISGAGGVASSAHGQGSYSTNMYRTFTVDGNGNAFVHNYYYNLKVWAYDNSGNTTESNVRVQYRIARPNSWAWHTTKTKGSTISLTASEWNSFCIRVNQFRQYRSLSNYSFTTVSSGQTITADIVNQAVNAIQAMSPPSSPPSTAISKSTVITALFFNTLSISLNSIQ